MMKLPDNMTIGEARGLGRMGDTELVHLHKAEVRALENLTPGLPLQINPETGEKEAFLQFLLPLLPSVFPSIGAGLGSALGIGGMLGTALASGGLGLAGGLLDGKSFKKSLMGGIGAGLMGGLGAKLAGTGAAAAGAGGSAANGGIAATVGAASNPAAMAGNWAQAAPGLGGAAAAAAPAAANTTTKAATNGMMKWLVPGLAMAGAGMGTPTMPTQPTKSPKDYDLTPAKARAKPRTVNQPPPGYVAGGADGEWRWFNPEDTVTQVVMPGEEGYPGYAEGGLVGNQSMPPFVNVGHMAPPQFQRIQFPQLPPINAGGPVSLPQYQMGMMPMMRPVMDPSQVNFQRRQVESPTSLPGAYGSTLKPPGAPQPQSATQERSPNYLRDWMETGRTNSPIAAKLGGVPMPGSMMSNRMASTAPYVMPQFDMSQMNINMPMFSRGGMVEGSGDGSSDHIEVKMGKKGKARLSDGEYVMPADVVAHMGNGSSRAGGKRLDQMVQEIRKARTGNAGMPPRI